MCSRRRRVRDCRGHIGVSTCSGIHISPLAPQQELTARLAMTIDGSAQGYMPSVSTPLQNSVIKSGRGKEYSSSSYDVSDNLSRIVEGAPILLLLLRTRHHDTGAVNSGTVYLSDSGREQRSSSHIVSKDLSRAQGAPIHPPQSSSQLFFFMNSNSHDVLDVSSRIVKGSPICLSFSKPASERREISFLAHQSRQRTEINHKLLSCVASLVLISRSEACTVPWHRS